MGLEDPPTRPHLFGLRPEDLQALLEKHGVACGVAEARRVTAHALAHGLDGYPTQRPVARRIERAVDALIERRQIELVERAEDETDGFVKYLFRSFDGALFEAVRIPLHVPGRFSVCLSTQVGCGMGCRFCATGRLGLGRNLEPWEIVAQFVAVRAEAPGRVTGAVFQGQGEPLGNLDAVLQAARVLCHPCGCRVAGDAVSISTVGLVPGILRLARERHRYRLIVSLTSAIDERRRMLIPVAAASPVVEVVEALRVYQQAIGGRVTVAWVVLGGINTGDDEVDALAELFADIPLRLNLIDVNDPRPDGFRRATPDELAAFRGRLQRLGVPVVRRYSGGAARHAACGMLASMRLGRVR